MKIEIKYNEDIHKRQLDSLFRGIHKKEIQLREKLKYAGLGLLFVAVVSVIFHRYFFGSLMIILCSIDLVRYGIQHHKLARLHKEFLEDEGFGKYQGLVVLDFNEDALIVSSDSEQSILLWVNFSKFAVVNQMLLALTADGRPLIIGAEEVGQEVFEKIVEFVSRKVIKGDAVNSVNER